LGESSLTRFRGCPPDRPVALLVDFNDNLPAFFVRLDHTRVKEEVPPFFAYLQRTAAHRITEVTGRLDIFPFALPFSLIYPRNQFFCFLGIVSKFVTIFFRKVSIEGRNYIEDKIRRHDQWDHQYTKAVRYYGKSGKENDISEVVDMHRISK
jgi:hypothetical protein